MDISGTTRVFMILGEPIAQVRAPAVFNHLFRQAGIDAVLVPASVAEADLAGFVRHALKARNIDGLWLTIPYKTALYEMLDDCDRLGQAAGAVNAVRRGVDGRLEGALFDGIGFARSLQGFGFDVAGRRVLLVGAGGAGVAIAASMATAGAAGIALHDLSPARTEAVVTRLRRHFDAPLVAAASADPAGFDLVVNCTPLGLRSDDPMPFDVARIDHGATVVDILMKSAPTPLLRACAERGIKAHPGFEMLVQQVPEYLAFFGYDALARQVSADPSELRTLFQAPGATLV
ncbi:Shikimate 5-dehydrogenase I alpha [Rubrivivax sp. A210]|uniref:shikimate dehydrogenase family protein n=1 Tax=Rubrivivax sp. A210 TaxID=2772301 RepID=UPI001918CFE9|nr:shikimate dehydrogenase [Rubrivivax sp. A210]CAD5375131.1 Shikimate 5-dehydrogenase I alpha [Rubrivivax sp. A210]